jgi:WD40 repeat protein
VTIANDGLARIWNEEGKLTNILKGHEGILYSASWNRDGSAIVTAGKDKIANLWDPVNG